MLMNNQIFIFLENSHILNFKMNGSLNTIYKLPSKIRSQPIIIDGSILYLNKKNKLIIVNQLFDFPLNKDNCLTFNPCKLSFGLIGYSPVK